MGAPAATIIGKIIVSVVVSKAASTVASKMGFGEGASNMLGMAAGMYAGGAVGAGSTAASADAASATTSQVGTQLPAGYGGPSSPTGSGFGGTGPTPGGAAPGSAPTLQAPTSPMGSGFAGTGPGSAPSLQAPATGAPPEPVQSSVLDSRTPIDESAAPGPGANTGYLKAAADQPVSGTNIEHAATTQAGQMAQDSTAKDLIKSELTEDTTRNAEKSWWEKLFSPEKTMDLAMAGMAGYGDAAMAKDDREYAERVAVKNEKGWQQMHGGMLSLGRDYPSQR